MGEVVGVFCTCLLPPSLAWMHGVRLPVPVPPPPPSSPSVLHPCMHSAASPSTPATFVARVFSDPTPPASLHHFCIPNALAALAIAADAFGFPIFHSLRCPDFRPQELWERKSEQEPWVGMQLSCAPCSLALLAPGTSQVSPKGSVPA